MKEFRYEEKKLRKRGCISKVSKVKAATLVKCRSARVCPERLKMWYSIFDAYKLSCAFYQAADVSHYFFHYVCCRLYNWIY